jgi:hypothetical protein
MRYILTIALILFALAGNAFAQERLLEKVPKLQETARRGNTGVLGCGVGAVTLITSKGQIKSSSNLDPIHVFGGTIRVSDLLPLLEARAESNRGGVSNPMSGNVSDLMYVVLYTLSLSKDPDPIQVIAELLKDKDDVIRGWSAIALYETAKSSEDLKTKIHSINFPQAAVDSAKGRGVEPPAGLQITSGI